MSSRSAAAHGDIIDIVPAGLEQGLLPRTRAAGASVYDNPPMPDCGNLRVASDWSPMTATDPALVTVMVACNHD